MVHKTLTQQNPYTSNSTTCNFNHFPCSAQYVDPTALQHNRQRTVTSLYSKYYYPFV